MVMQGNQSATKKTEEKPSLFGPFWFINESDVVILQEAVGKPSVMQMDYYSL